MFSIWECGQQLQFHIFRFIVDHFLKKKKKKVKKGSVQSDSLLIIMNSLTMSATYMYSNVADNCRKHPSVDALYEGFNGLN